MKLRLLSLFLFCLSVYHASAQVCAGNGNLMLFTNYDGGILNINVDANIPNLKIGICSYEPVQVNITGAYVGNITQVLYAGFNSTQNNNHCNLTGLVTAINGVPANITDIETYPPATIQNANGYPLIICAYSCDTASSQGGCNTVDQVVHYFSQTMGATMYAHYIQYGCWSGTYNVSAGGTCCVSAPGLQGPPPTANFAVDNDTICEGQCLTFTNSSIDATAFEWSFPGATPSSSTAENPTFVCYTAAGTYPVTLIATNANGSDTIEYTNYINVAAPPTSAGFSYQQINNYTVEFTANNNGATTYSWLYNNVEFATGATASYNFPSEDYYTIKLISANSCGSDTVSMQIFVMKIGGTGVDETMLKGINLYPNPAQNLLQIQTTQPVNYTVYDVVGKQLLSGNTTGNTTLDISALNKGLYIIRFAANGKQAVMKVVKE